MALVSKPLASPVFELKSATLTLVSLALRTADLDALARELDAQAAASPGLFDQEPVVLDFSALRDSDAELDVDALVALLRRHGILPVAVKAGSAEQMQAARLAGLGEAPEGAPPAPPRPPAVPPKVKLTEVLEPPPPAPAPPQPRPVLVVDKPLRSGQQVYARGGDLVVLAVVSFGAEVIADGSIHVYAPLRGRAVAGAKGQTDARIYSTCMEPQLVAIAGTYRTTETALPADVLGKPAQVRLDGDRLVVEPLSA